jgi:antitoxin ParD1/3/4
MSVTLSPEIETRITTWVEQGRYASVDDALKAAIRLLEEHDNLQRLKDAIAIGDAQIARGEGIELTSAVWDEIEREADEAERLRLPLRSDVYP